MEREVLKGALPVCNEFWQTELEKEWAQALDRPARASQGVVTGGGAPPAGAQCGSTEQV